ncbi:MAG: ribonuclease HI family protein [Chloroflexota bacterium]|jgi:ribonuclease HI
MTITLYFDGLFMGIPKKSCPASGAGFMCYGWIAWRGSRIIARGHGGYLRGRDASSNIAEYLALIEGLEALLDMGAIHESIHIIGDARSIIEQMQGTASVHSNHIRPLHEKAQQIAGSFRWLDWEWIPRRSNREADALTRRALRQIRANPSSYAAALQAINPALSGSRQARKFWPVLDLRIYI